MTLIPGGGTAASLAIDACIIGTDIKEAIDHGKAKSTLQTMLQNIEQTLTLSEQREQLNHDFKTVQDAFNQGIDPEEYDGYRLFDAMVNVISHF